MANSIFMGIGIIIGWLTFYLGFWVGRKTGYEDKNVPPPPNPLGVGLPSITKPKENKPAGWIDDYSDPSMGEFKPGSEL